MKWKTKGYLTVEASLIISMSVIVAGLMISLCFHIYQLCWYTQAACETVMSGSSQSILKGSDALEKAEEKWEIRKNEFYPVPENFSSSVSGNKKEISHKITGSTPVWGKFPLQIDVSVSQKLVRPVNFIRKIAALAE